MPALPRDYAGGRPRGVGGDPKVILFATFVDWAEKFFVTHAGLTDAGQTDVSVEIVI